VFSLKEIKMEKSKRNLSERLHILTILILTMVRKVVMDKRVVKRISKEIIGAQKIWEKV
jgi:hypothetical protein